METALSIVIPILNEAETIAETLLRIKDNIPTPHEVILVYESEEDTTLPVVKACNDPSVRLIKNKFQRGVINAIKTGLESARQEAILVTMADLSDDLKTVAAMLEKFNNGADIVCGSRHMKGGKQQGGPPVKTFISTFSCLFLYYTTNIPTHDVTNNFKLYRKSVLDRISITSSGGFEIGMEITVKGFLSGYTVTEVPTVWKDRTKGESNFKLFAWIPHYIRWALLLFLTQNRISRCFKRGFKWVSHKKLFG